MHRQAVAALVLGLNAATLGSAPASACSEHRSYYGRPAAYHYYAPAPAYYYASQPAYYYVPPPAYGYYPPASVYGYDRSYDYRPPVYGYRDVGWRRW